jgi:N-acetylmuramoyl-L-alanine amidase
VSAHRLTVATGLCLLAALLPARALAGPLSGRTIVVDPGHNPGNGAHAAQIGRTVFAGIPENGGYKACDTAGTETASGYAESLYTWDVAHRLALVLERLGARVVLTRTASSPAYGPCIDERAAIGNRVHAAAAISIHADGGPSSASARGFCVIANAAPIASTGLTAAMVAADARLARAIRTSYASGTGMPYSSYLGRDGLLGSNEYGGLDLSHVPKVLIETGNMRSPVDAALLESPAFRERAARALAAGLAAYLAR